MRPLISVYNYFVQTYYNLLLCSLCFTVWFFVLYCTITVYSHCILYLFQIKLFYGKAATVGLSRSGRASLGCPLENELPVQPLVSVMAVFFGHSASQISVKGPITVALYDEIAVSNHK